MIETCEIYEKPKSKAKEILELFNQKEVVYVLLALVVLLLVVALCA